MSRSELTRPSEVQRILSRLDFKPSKVLGQNFLIDQNILDLLLDIAQVDSSDHVLEVGPGLGVLTHALAERAGAVIAVEKDDRLFRYLSKHLCNHPTVELVHADILDVFPDKLPMSDITKVTANLPYSISGRFLTELCLCAFRPTDIVVTVQQEVGERLAAGPGNKQYGMLSVFAQARYHTRRCKIISSSCFLPRPQVKSAIVHLQRREEDTLPDNQVSRFQQLVKACFSQRRKQLGTIFDKIDASLQMPPKQLEQMLLSYELTPKSRPEEVPVELWLALAQSYDRQRP